MIPGPIIIRKCRECSKLIEEGTIISGNTLGAIFWTDGKREAPMLPDHPWLVECPHCHALLWIEEQEFLDEIEPGDDVPAQFEGSRPCNAPSFDGYLNLLDKGVTDLQKEKYLRWRAWWVGNDERRNAGVKPALSDRERQNLQAFAKILDETDPNDRLTKAEIMRELCRFDDAIVLLSGHFDRNFAEAVAIIRDMAQKKEPFVAEIRFD